MSICHSSVGSGKIMQSAQALENPPRSHFVFTMVSLSWSASSSVSSRSRCSPCHSIVCRTQQGLIRARGIPICHARLKKKPTLHGTQLDGNADSQGTVVGLASSIQLSPHSLANSSDETPAEDTILDLDHTK